MKQLKKIHALFLAVIIFITSIIIVSGTKTTVLIGDINGDNTVSAYDARIVLLSSAGLHTGIDKEIADIDDDNKITAIDARYILRASAQLESLVCIRYGHDLKNGNCINCDYKDLTTEPESETSAPETTTTVTETTTTAPETTTKAPGTTTIPEETTTKEPDTTTTVPETTTIPAAPDNLPYEIFEKINDYRASLGLYPLKFNAELSEITAVRAQEASVYWSHTRPDGRSFWTVFTDYNKFTDKQMGEILANIGAPEAKRAVNGWINSPTHNAILVTTRYTEIGIAYYESDSRWYIAAHTI